MAAKMTTIVVGVTGLQQRHHPKSIPHLVKTTKGKIVSKYFNISKTLGGLPSTPPLYHDGWMDLLVRPRVKNFIEKQLQRFRYRFMEHSFGSFLAKILRWDRPCANKSISIFHPFLIDDCITLYLSCH